MDPSAFSLVCSNNKNHILIIKSHDGLGRSSKFKCIYKQEGWNKKIIGSSRPLANWRIYALPKGIQIYLRHGAS